MSRRAVAALLSGCAACHLSRYAACLSGFAALHALFLAFFRAMLAGRLRRSHFWWQFAHIPCEWCLRLVVPHPAHLSCLRDHAFFLGVTPCFVRMPQTVFSDRPYLFAIPGAVESRLQL